MHGCLKSFRIPYRSILLYLSMKYLLLLVNPSKICNPFQKILFKHAGRTVIHKTKLKAKSKTSPLFSRFPMSITHVCNSNTAR